MANVKKQIEKLDVACYRGDWEQVEELLKLKPVPQDNAVFFYRRLIAGLLRFSNPPKYWKTVRALKKGELYPTVVDHETGFTALHIFFLRPGPNFRFKFLKPFLGFFRTKDLNASDHKGNTIAHLVVLSGDLAGLNWLLENVPALNWNLHNHLGLSPLHTALLTNHSEIFKTLLESPKVDIHLCTRKSAETVLHLAARLGDLDIVNLLLEKGLRTTCCDRLGRTPLHSAVFSAQISVIPALAQNSSLVSTDNENNNLFHMVSGGLRDTEGSPEEMADREKVMEWLLSSIPDPSEMLTSESHLKLTPILHAISEGRGALVKIMAQKLGASVTEIISDPTERERALILCCTSPDCDTTILDSLLQDYEVSRDGSPSLLHIAAFGGNSAGIKFLCSWKNKAGEHPFSVNERATINGIENITPFHLACYGGSTSTITTLLLLGADILAEDSHGYLPFHWAVISDKISTESISELIDCYLNTDANVLQGNDGRTPLFWAIQRNPNIVGFLITDGMDKGVEWLSPDWVDTCGDTALHVASRVNDVELGCTLLDLGWDPEYRNSYGQLVDRRFLDEVHHMIEENVSSGLQDLRKLGEGLDLMAQFGNSSSNSDSGSSYSGSSGSSDSGSDGLSESESASTDSSSEADFTLSRIFEPKKPKKTPATSDSQKSKESSGDLEKPEEFSDSLVSPNGKFGRVKLATTGARKGGISLEDFLAQQEAEFVEGTKEKEVQTFGVSALADLKGVSSWSDDSDDSEGESVEKKKMNIIDRWCSNNDLKEQKSLDGDSDSGSGKETSCSDSGSDWKERRNSMDDGSHIDSDDESWKAGLKAELKALTEANRLSETESKGPKMEDMEEELKGVGSWSDSESDDNGAASSDSETPKVLESSKGKFGRVKLGGASKGTFSLEDFLASEIKRTDGGEELKAKMEELRAAGDESWGDSDSESSEDDKQKKPAPERKGTFSLEDYLSEAKRTDGGEELKAKMEELRAAGDESWGDSDSESSEDNKQKKPVAPVGVRKGTFSLEEFLAAQSKGEELKAKMQKFKVGDDDDDSWGNSTSDEEEKKEELPPAGARKGSFTLEDFLAASEKKEKEEKEGKEGKGGESKSDESWGDSDSDEQKEKNINEFSELGNKKTEKGNDKDAWVFRDSESDSNSKSSDFSFSGEEEDFEIKLHAGLESANPFSGQEKLAELLREIDSEEVRRRLKRGSVQVYDDATHFALQQRALIHNVNLGDKKTNLLSLSLHQSAVAMQVDNLILKLEKELAEKKIEISRKENLYKDHTLELHFMRQKKMEVENWIADPFANTRSFSNGDWAFTQISLKFLVLCCLLFTLLQVLGINF
eukprot:TRINITY_DN1359_c0_g1_i7.p1 TRINITY_DN1359_c0_g1~~TRINITY_DN1359_c0_g1_i7.p1  ORF type:complete len:1344 (-),score=307.24 TRINITY_DN1359_c0_g1_i7:1511-5518(-)